MPSRSTGFVTGQPVAVMNDRELCSVLARVGEDAYPVRVSKRGSRFIIEKEGDNGERE